MDDTVEPQHPADERRSDPSSSVPDDAIGTPPPTPVDAPTEPTDQSTQAGADSTSEPRGVRATKLQRAQARQGQDVAARFARPIVQQLLEQQRQQAADLRRAIQGPLHESVMLSRIPRNWGFVGELSAAEKKRRAEMEASMRETARWRAERDAAAYQADVAGFLRGPSSARPLIEHGLAVVNERHGTAYELQHKVIDAVDYGVPQRRQRVIAMAIRSGRNFGWPEATHTHAPARCWDAIGALQEPGVPSPTGRWAGLLPSIPEGSNYQWHTDRGGGEPLFGYRTRYWSFLLKLARDQPSWTLPASPGPSTGPFHWDNRPLTTTERLRLQSFPANWFVPGDRQAPTRLVGNATPPLLAEVIGRAIAAQLDDAEPPPNPTLAIQRVALVPPPVPPAPVPSAYMHMRGRHAAHPGTGLGPAPRRPRAGSSALPPPHP
jgi:hypothetical protein